MGERYTPPAGEYRRPEGRFEIEDPRGEPSFDNHFVRGTQFAKPSVFGGLIDGKTMSLEMVPEPGNPFDCYAVALQFNGLRMGYLASESAKSWQDIVVAHNRRGQAVYATGIVEFSGAGKLNVTVFLPWLRKSKTDLNAGTWNECAAIFSGLSGKLQQEALSDFWVGLSEDCLAEIINLRGCAPSLNWNMNSGHSLPFQLSQYFASIVMLARQLNEDLKQAEREVLRLAAYESHLAGDTPRAMASWLGCSAEKASRLLFEYFSGFSPKQLAAMRPAKSSDQQLLETSVLTAHNSGFSISEITRRTKSSREKVLAIILADGQEVTTDRQLEMRQERLAKARQALAMRKETQDRRAIAAILGCSFDVLASLLADGEFYEDPAQDKQRLKRALRCRDAKVRGLCIEEAAIVAGMSVGHLRQARKDRAMLLNLHGQHFIQD